MFSIDGELYRGINPDQSKRFEEMIRNGTIPSLIQAGFLIDTDIAGIPLPGFGLTLRHRRVEHQSFPDEWGGEMLRAAALLVARLQIELLDRGLSLQDAHPNNVIFENTRPIFVDVSSIVPDDGAEAWLAQEEFRRFFLHPLYLMAAGQGRIARMLLASRDGVSHMEFAAFAAYRQTLREHVSQTLLSATRRVLPPGVRRRIKDAVPGLSGRISGAGQNATKVAALRDVITEIQALSFPTDASDWLSYAASRVSLDDRSDWKEKQVNIEKIIAATSPNSVVDIGCNTGWYSVLAARQAPSVVALDWDEACINALFVRARSSNLPILPLVMDFRQLPVGKVVCSEAHFPPPERMRSDMVIAGAIVHHLVFKGLLTFEQIATGLAAFARRHLVVEFVPRDDEFVEQWWSERYSWYSLENFQFQLSRHFKSVEVLPSSPAPRVLLHCQK